MVFYARKRSFKSTGFVQRAYNQFAGFKRRRFAAVGRRRRFPMRRRTSFRRWRPKYHRKSASQKIVIHKKSHMEQPTKVDRDHIIMDKCWKGTTTWTVGSLAYTSIALTMPFDVGGGATDETKGWPHTNLWINAGTSSTYTSAGAAPAFMSEIALAQRWMYAYVSSATVTWEVARTDHGDDETLYATMVPVSREQQLTDMTGTFPNTVWAGTSTAYELLWERSQQAPIKKTIRLTNALGEKGMGTLRMHIPIKKYFRPGYPQNTSVNWYSILAGPTYTAPVKGPLLWLGMYSNGVATPILVDHTINVKFYVTYFMPRVPLAITLIPTGPVGEELMDSKADEESKEEKKTSLTELIQQDYDEVEECVKAAGRLSVATPPPAPCPPPARPSPLMGPPPPRAPRRGPLSPSAT